MTAVAVRRVVLVVCAGGIAGMIVTNIAGNNGGSVTFGLVTAVAVLCSIVATAVSTGGGARAAHGGGQDADALGARVEERIARLASAGADEAELRALASDAVMLGRAAR